METCSCSCLSLNTVIFLGIIAIAMFCAGFAVMCLLEDEYPAFAIFISVGIFFLFLACITAYNDPSFLSQEITTCEMEEKTEISDLTTDSMIKIAIIDNYPDAEIITYNDKSGKFIYENDKYDFSVEGNVIFITKNNKLSKYIYLK